MATLSLKPFLMTDEDYYTTTVHLTQSPNISKKKGLFVDSESLAIQRQRLRMLDAVMDYFLGGEVYVNSAFCDFLPLFARPSKLGGRNRVNRDGVRNTVCTTLLPYHSTRVLHQAASVIQAFLTLLNYHEIKPVFDTIPFLYVFCSLTVNAFKLVFAHRTAATKHIVVVFKRPPTGSTYYNLR